MKINTKFSINDKVYITPLKVEGIIKGIYVDSGGVTFNTRYFDGLKPLDCYFIERELSLEEPKKDVGFKNE